MKNWSAFQNVTIGVFLGILISGLFLLGWNSIQRRNMHSELLTIRTATNSAQLNFDLPVTSTKDEGKIDINQADLSSLVTLPGIGESKANAIIEFREKYGPFVNIAELSYVPGIGDKLFKTIEDMVTIGHE